MKIVFMGTPDFAAASLERLYSDGREVTAVFTQPDKPKNRGLKLAASPVKELAQSRGTPIYQPATLRDGEALRQLEALKPDLIAVVAYGKLLPKEILTLPKYGCVNIHGSLLPKYRGAAPVQWAVLNGETTTGVTSMYMAEEMDAGDIIFKKETAIGDEETAGELYDRLAALGAVLLGETIDAIEGGAAPRIPQDHQQATFAPPLRKEQAPIDWTRTAREILCQIRGLNPWPVATAELAGVCFKIYKAVPGQPAGTQPPGSLIAAGKGGIEVACRDGSIVIAELQAPGGKRMAAADYLRGHPICV
jgi:methionyl-tRNA formyltransferase